MKKVLFFIALMFFLPNVGLNGEPQKQVEIKGTLRMYLLNFGGEAKRISKYRETDWMRETVVFVIEVDRTMDIRSYLDKDEWDFLDKNQQSAFMVVPRFKYDGKNFAAKYANKRVRALGTFYAPGGGWRNMTTVVMDLKEISLQ